MAKRKTFAAQQRMRIISQLAKSKSYLPGYRFTKGLTQNLNLHTNLKLKYILKSLNYVQQNFSFLASFLFYWTVFYFFDMISGLKVIKIGNDCVTLHFA